MPDEPPPFRFYGRVDLDDGFLLDQQGYEAHEMVEHHEGPWADAEFFWEPLDPNDTNPILALMGAMGACVARPGKPLPPVDEMLDRKPRREPQATATFVQPLSGKTRG